jgi:hypothetical protein
LGCLDKRGLRLARVTEKGHLVMRFAERDKIRHLLDRGGPINHALSLDTLFDVRFLAKLAIAFGHKLFGERYGTLHYTDRLRALLWTRRTNLNLEQHRVRMRSYFSGLQDHSMQLFSFAQGFVFIFKYVDGELALMIVFPSGRFVLVPMTELHPVPKTPS